MRKLFTLKLFCLYFLFLGSIAILSSCQKIAGHSVGTAASGAGTGIGTIAVGASGTFIYQIGTGAVVTYNTPNVGFLIGTDTVRNVPATAIIATNPLNNDGFELVYSATTAGTFDAQGLLSTTTLNKQSTYGGQKVNITFQNTGSTAGSSLIGAGTIKGTFTGTMTDVSGANPVSVQGSFNITQ